MNDTETTTYLTVTLSKASRSLLLERVPALFEGVRADHVTVTLEPTEEQLALEGRSVKFQVTGHASARGVQAVTVRGVAVAGEVAHVTVSVAAGHKAQEATGMLVATKVKMLKSFVLEGVYKTFSH